MKAKQLTIYSLSIALVTLSTLALKFDLPNGGYFNVGDTMIFIIATAFGPITGMIAGGIGSGLADFLGGWPIYIIGTTLIKGFEGYLVGYFIKHGLKDYLTYLIGAVLLVIGYFAYEIILYGVAGALPGVIANTLQGLLSILIAMLLYPVLHKAFLGRFSKIQ